MIRTAMEGLNPVFKLTVCYNVIIKVAKTSFTSEANPLESLRQYKQNSASAKEHRRISCQKFPNFQCLPLLIGSATLEGDLGSKIAAIKPIKAIANITAKAPPYK